MFVPTRLKSLTGAADRNPGQNRSYAETEREGRGEEWRRKKRTPGTRGRS